MSRKVYVGNLSFSTDEETLRTAFEEGGRTVTSVAVITDRVTGRPRGFAFVELGTVEEAEAAISDWDGRELDGRKLRVNAALDQPRRNNMGGGMGGPGMGGGGGGGDHRGPRRRPGGGGGGGMGGRPGGGGRGGRF